MTDATLSARELILALLDSSSSATLKASYLVAAGARFGMDPRSIRVALGRLVKDGSLTQSGRGEYAPHSRSGELRERVRNWATVEDTLVPWSGRWLAVPLGDLGRSNKSRVRARERALRLLGFAAHSATLWLRPANLADAPQRTRERLLDLGLDTQAVLLEVSDVAPDDGIDAEQLWPRAALEAGYREQLRTLSASRARLATLDEAAAGRETLLVGRAVTRAILLDPLLPEELVDTNLRGRVVTEMAAYDRLGKDLWRAFYATHYTTHVHG